MFGKTLATRSDVRLPWAIGGFAVAALFLVLYYKPEILFVDSGVWDRVGDEVRTGTSPYYVVPQSGGFFFAPPWAVAFAALSWLPVQVLSIAILAAEILALRYIAGSWLRIGYLCWLPLVAAELELSQFNLIIAAALVAAARGAPAAAVAAGFAKLSPFLGIDPRDWRKVLVPGLVLLAITVPFLGLWLDWARLLTESYGATISTVQLQVPFLPRLVGAIALAAFAFARPHPVWSPALRIVAVFVATPALYPVSSVVLLALVALPWRDGLAPSGRALRSHEQAAT